VGRALNKVDRYAQNGGIIGIMLLRMIPVAPFAAINIGLGMLKIPVHIFLLGTFLGFLPSAIGFLLLGSALLMAWENPDAGNIAFTVLAFAGWIGFVALATYLTRRIYAHFRHSEI
jgi:uncharacterized membrane protein YdjX (TVP38/TMEM64 family)